jgi:N-acetylglutamate synthase-like GNAT family acetyltransferase
MEIRKATINDIESLIQLRIDYLVMDKGHISPKEEDAIRKQVSSYLKKHIPLGDFIAVLAIADNVIISSAFLVVSERPANPSFPTGLIGTLLNVITYPPYRRKGYAQKVIQKIIEEAKELGISTIELHSTKEGEELYKKLGFSAPPYTSLRLEIHK